MGDIIEDKVCKSLEELTAENNKLHKRLDECEKLLNKDPLPKFFKIENGEAVFEMEHWAVKLLAQSLADSLGDSENFITFTVNSYQDKLAITIQKCFGKSPAEAISELKDDIDSLEDKISELEDEISDLETENADLSSDNEDLEQEINEKDQEIEDLQAQIWQLDDWENK